MKRFIAFLSLFTSFGTIVCCALPALFVILGMGAAFAGLVSTFPQLIWLSEHKLIVFGAGAALLSLGGILQWNARSITCPTDPALGQACATTRDWSRVIYLVAVGLYLVGALFAFVAPSLL